MYIPFSKLRPEQWSDDAQQYYCNTEAVVQKIVLNNFNIIITLLYVYTDVYERR